MSDTVITTTKRPLRQLRGTTFLGLEHALKAALLVVVTMLLVSAVGLAFQMWTGQADDSTLSLLGLPGAGVIAGTAMTIAAGLLVFVPALIILELRTSAEYRVRSQFGTRLAYKLPLYAAFAVLLGLLAVAAIQLLASFLTSLTLLGVDGANIGAMYLSQFVPALLAMGLYAVAAWYVLQVLKGKNGGAGFVLSAAVLASMMVLALFITSIVFVHSSTASQHQDSGTVEDFFRDYNSRNDSF
jgi:hypothetical protein